MTPICCPTGWKVVFANGRFTNPAESRYAPIEGEALSVAHGLEKAKHFVLGCKNLIVATDHKPLLKVLGDRKLEDIGNPRLLNLKEKTLPFRFKIIHVPGKMHKAPDATSRYPTGPKEPSKLHLEDDSHEEADALTILNAREEATEALLDKEIIHATASTLDTFHAITWQRLQEATTSDLVMQNLIEIIEEGFPIHKREMPAQLQEYHQFRESLSTVDGVILYKDRLLVPPSLRHEVLSALHAAHQGVTAMNARAEISVFWPGITAQILEVRTKCQDCNRMAPSQPSAPPTTPTDPTYPFQCICSDYFKYMGSNYLIIVDRYSNWPVVNKASDGAKGLVKSLREAFVTYGIPEELASDGGPEYASTETSTFLKSWGVRHRISSVAFPHSNCRAEVGVKTCKRMITGNAGPNGEIDVDKFQRAMLQYRNGPDQDTKLSPAMIVFGRPTKDFIPILPGRYQPHNTWAEVRSNREVALSKRHMKISERLSEHTKVLPELTAGDNVRIQNQVGPNPLKWDKTGKVIEVHQHDQYVVKLDGSGRVTMRNRKFLRKFSPFMTKAADMTLPRYMPPKEFTKVDGKDNVTDDQGRGTSNVNTVPTSIDKPQLKDNVDQAEPEFVSTDPKPTSVDTHVIPPSNSEEKGSIEPIQAKPPPPQASSPIALRRSTRIRRPTSKFQIPLGGGMR